MNFDNYYDSRPARLPRVPISIIGFLGADQEVVGSTLGSLTALSFCHVPNLIAHKMGTSAPRVMAERGEAAYRALERECTRMALADRPAGIVALGDGALLHAESRTHIVENSVLVYLHHDIEEITTKIQGKLESNPTRFYPWIQGENVCRGDLAAVFEERMVGYQEATLQVDATGRTAIEIARELKEELGL